MNSDNTEINIYNLLGSKISSTKVNKNNLSADFDYTKYGMYIIEIKTANSVYTRKFVITE